MPILAAKPRRTTGEKNIYKLPRGERLRREMVAVFGEQRSKVLRFLRTGRKDVAGHRLRADGDRAGDRSLASLLASKDQIHPGALPVAWPDWHDFGLGALEMAQRFVPLLTLTWDAAGQRFGPRVGLDPDVWSVVNPHTERMIDDAALAFCDSTNETTSLALDEALAKTRQELHEGVVEQGESVEALTRRINAIFDGAQKWRARRIAQTETSRAVHAAQEQAAIQSGVVTGWEWLLSGDACPICMAIAARARFVRLGHAFAVIGDNPHYSQVRFPPAHPHCNCSVVEVLDTDDQPEWSDTLHQPEEATEDEHQAVAERTQARDDVTLGGPPPAPPVMPKPPRAPRAPRPIPAKPAAPAWQWGQPVDPDRPIAERIKTSPAWERTKELAEANTLYVAAREAARAADKAHLQLFGEITTALQGNPTTEERAELSRRIQASLADLKELRRVRDSAKGKAAIETTRILSTPNGVTRFRWDTDDSKLTTDSSRMAAVEADIFVRKIAAAGPDAIDKAKVSFHTIPKSQTQRAHCKDWLAEIYLKQTEDPGTAVHEWGHQIEHTVPGVRAATREFLAHRVGSEPLQSMGKLNPHGQYMPDEMGREDDFRKVFGDHAGYVGKHYDGASEIISMGLEMLYNDPGHFAKNDPEYCSFILGILDGSLRKP